MARRIQHALVLVLSLLLLSVTANSPVHIMSKYQLITSTTLNWLPHTHYRNSHEIVIGGVEVVKEVSASTQTPIFVCRALHNGIWVAGGLKEGEKRCLVTSLSSVKSYEKYDLLENTESAARVSWVDWDKYKDIPVGTVAPSGSESYFVARHLAEGVNEDSLAQTHYIGTLNTKDGLGKITYIKSDGAEGSAERGQVLVETEPIRYELNSVKLNANKIREKKRVSKVLGTATLKNTGSQTGNMAEVFTYSYNYSQYWGQGHAILKGLNTSITLLNKTKLPDIVWGISEKKLVVEDLTVEYLLEPGTAVNVTLVANYTDMETSYMANLVAVYEDQTTKDRRISGFRQEETMRDVRPEFSPVFFLHNNSLVPTTVPPPTTTTTITTTTTAAPESILMTKEMPLMEGPNQETVDENMITPQRKSDGSNIQNDDGGPLSLKNKIESDSSSGQSFVPSLLTIAVSFILAFIRIT